MKKNILLITLAVLILGSCYTVSKVALQDIPEPSYDEKPVIAVINFQNKTGDSAMDPLMENITGSMISELQNTGYFRIIERERLKSILKELKFNLGGMVDAEKAKQIGKMLGVDALLFGNLSSVKYSRNKQTIFIAWTEGQKVEVAMDARLVNVETGEVLAASKASSFIKQRNWVAFWFARLGKKTNKDTIIQTGIDQDIKQIANDIAAKTPTRGELGR